MLSALAFGIGFLPQLFGSLLLGSMADRLPPRALIAGGYALACAAALLLALVRMPIAASLGVVALVALATPVFSGASAAAPFGDVGLPTVDPADVAEVAAVVLREGGHAGSTYDLTGPAPVTPRERAEAIGEALGTPVRFIEQTRAEARAQMLSFMPEPVVEGTLAILGEPLPAEQETSPAVERILGRAPRAFADWAARTAPAFQ